MTPPLLRVARSAPSVPPVRSVGVGGAACLVRAALASLLATAAGNALSLPDSRLLGRYDFGYELQGDDAARPVQVFSDGAGTVYLQFAPGAPVPAIFAARAPQLLVPRTRGPFQVVRTRAREFVLALGAARARVVHAGGLASPTPYAAAPSAEAAPAASAASSPSGESGESGESGASSPSEGDTGAAGSDSTGSSHDTNSPPLRWSEPERRHDAPLVFLAGSASLTPEAQASLDSLVARLGAQAVLTLEGRGDISRSDGLAAARASALRAALVARGVAAGRLRERASDTLSEPLVAGDAARAGDRRVAAVVRWTTPATERELGPAGVAIDAGTWDVRRADRDIAGSLRRWASRAGWRVEWATDISAPVTGEARLEAGSFVEVVGRVVAGLQSQGYPVRARAVGDRTVRFEEAR